MFEKENLKRIIIALLLFGIPLAILLPWQHSVAESLKPIMRGSHKIKPFEQEQYFECEDFAGSYLRISFWWEDNQDLGKYYLSSLWVKSVVIDNSLTQPHVVFVQYKDFWLGGYDRHGERPQIAKIYTSEKHWPF